MKLLKNTPTDKVRELFLGLDKIPDSLSLSAENMIPSAAGIKTRPGLSPLYSSPLFDPYEYSGQCEFKLTSCFAEIDGQSYQLATVTESDEYSYISYHVYAFSSAQSKRYLGDVTFNRTSPDSFSTPISLTFYSGEPTRGGGIYMLAYLTGGEENYISLYEINSSFSSWSRLESSDFYTPTLFINGHGDSLNMAVNQDSLKLSTVKNLEPLNLLSESFCCYFTTDGHSAAFTMPKISAAPDSIVCSFEDESNNRYEWQLYRESGYTATVSVNGVSVTAELLPENFSIIFSSHSSKYPLAYVGRENNLKLSVYAPMSKKSEAMLAMSSSCSVKNVCENSSSSVTVFSDNLLKPSLVCWLDTARPLYFPETAFALLGTEVEAGTLLMPLDNRIFLFKGSSVFSADITAAAKYDIKRIISSLEDADSVGLPSISFDRRITLPSALLPATLCAKGESFWFCGEDRRVYSLSSSLKISEYELTLSKTPRAAAAYDGKYLLFCGRECEVILMGSDDKSGKYGWIFPTPIVASANLLGQTVLFDTDSIGAINAFTLSGGEDEFFSYENGERALVSRKITSVLRLTAHKSAYKCRLHTLSADLSLDEDGLLELLDSGRKIGYRKITNGRNIIKTPYFYNELVLLLSLGGGTASAIGIKYRELKKF